VWFLNQNMVVWITRALPGIMIFVPLHFVVTMRLTNAIWTGSVARYAMGDSGPEIGNGEPLLSFPEIALVANIYALPGRRDLGRWIGSLIHLA
jgi:hypothetical protein